MSEPLRVFGYGSLMYEPELPGGLDDMVDATLPGWRRAFDKRSEARGCAEADALLPTGLPGWTAPGRRVSLCLGLQADAGAHVAGKLLVYRPDVATRVRAALDGREGVQDDRDPLLNGYARRLLPVTTPTGVVQAVVYVTRPGSVLHAPGLDVDQTADVLAHATPRLRGARALGADYLFDALAVLDRVGVQDGGLAGLGDAVARRVGRR